mmetsp:Transcript_15494/g.43377  ORF Transcript_15494/g.43377 Transcript_15494/m.43377 type:complete len:157 (+) Transcript_15494:135-605(+)|eukprot:CAMPEP_0117661744 /NCGR_PEP_ID=MMETSP0804-20121206/7697_1 /TAXON_ID=1074897 /ORGANISM="Tetraselmis astigmatica, Strain CCMP880" /LENGTH=156 /DNA_ID=CAMNT_0005468625 /DNA_START=104 /DNA_END=577 /DNA_ORIENTATION=+
MGGVRLRKTGNLLYRVKRLLKSGIFAEPVWLEALEKVPPTEFPKKGARPGKVEFPESQLIKYYTYNNPEVLNIPIRLDSYVPSPARQFVARQMEVMEERGLSKAEAAKVVAEEFDAKRAAMPFVPQTSMLRKLQTEESRELAKAMQLFRDASSKSS